MEYCKHCKNRDDIEKCKKCTQAGDSMPSQYESIVVEHDGCSGCKYAKLDDYEEPCIRCKGTRIPNGTDYNNTPDLYEPVTKDLISHPSHYCYSEYEPKDVIRAWGLNFNLGSAVKYIARAGRKDDILQELNKAKQFITFEIEAIEKERGLRE